MPLELLDEFEAAKYLRVKVEKLRWMRWREMGPNVIKIGRTPVYDQADLDAYIDSCRRSSQMPAGEKRSVAIQKAG